MGDAECPMCGAPLEEDDDYCPECGSNFQQENQEPEEKYDEFSDDEE